MKQPILASSIVGIKDFAAAAAAHSFELKTWRAHMERVAEDQKHAVLIERRHVGYPRPRAHPLVERAVDENDDVNFEIVDDGPTAEDRLAARKAELINAVSIAENKAIDSLRPIGKRRLFNLREFAIRAADQTRAAALVKSNAGLVKKLTGGAMTPDQIAARIEAERPVEDTAHLRAQEEYRARVEMIGLAAAHAYHDIEDLTAETIGGWKLPIF
jgi:hypothetical protein